MSLLSWLGTAFSNATKWLKKAEIDIKHDAAKLAVVLTEEVKPLLEGVIGIAIAALVDNIFSTHVAEDVRLLIVKEINITLAAELALEGLPADATPEQVESFAASLVKMYAGVDVKGKTKLFSTLTAQVISIVEEFENKNTSLTFALAIGMSEKAFQAYKKDLADEAANQAAQTDETNN